MARFLEAIAHDDTSQNFSGMSRDGAHGELATAMTDVLSRLRAGRTAREAQAQYLQTLINHVLVALISIEESGDVQLLNMAARRLFESPLTELAQFARHGESFAVGMESLRAGDTAILRMERLGGTLQLKAVVTHVSAEGVRRRLVSLQNIETE